MLKRFAFAVFLILLAVFITVKLIGRPTKFAPENIKSELETTALNFYLEQAHPTTGLVRDTAENFSDTPDSNRMASLSATGFGLAVIANAATRGMVDPTFARDYVLKVVRFCRDHVDKRRGWFTHFVDWETGVRFGRSEFSTVDTSLFMGGAMYAAQVLQDPEISRIVHQFYVDLDFQDFMTDGGAQPKKKTLTQGFLPEEGYTANQWNLYSEQKLLLLLGLGHPTHPLPAESWQSFERNELEIPGGAKMMGRDLGLFVHQYSELFVDFRAFHDGFPNYFENGVTATRYHRDMARSDPQYKSLRAGFWGFSAGAAPHNGYETWSPNHHIGMVCIVCALSSAMFMPHELLDDASTWALGPYHKQIWGRYGFTDSIDLDQTWYASHVYGITVGPEFLSLANILPETSMYREFMKIPEIQNALQRASISGGKGPPQATQKPSEREPGSLPQQK